MTVMSQETVVRFWAKVSKGEPNVCWPWLGAKKPKGYGNVRINKRYLIAHRVAYELTNGPIPEGLVVMHSCDNPSCCNPAHLSPGTVLENTEDMITKGRGNFEHGNRCFGQRNCNATLSSKQVDELRSMYVRGQVKQSELAVKFGISQAAVSAIILRKVRVYG